MPEDNAIESKIGEAVDLLKNKSQVIDNLGKTLKDHGDELAKLKEENSAYRKEVLERVDKQVSDATTLKEDLDNAFHAINSMKAAQEEAADKLGRPSEIKKKFDEAKGRAWLEGGERNKAEAEALQKEYIAELKEKGLSVGANPNGGFLREIDQSAGVAAFFRDISPIARYATNIATSASSVIRCINVGGATAGFVGELQDRTNTNTSQIHEVEIPSCELYARPTATRRSLDFSLTDLESWVNSETQEAYAEVSTQAWAVGNDPKTPLGFATKDLITSNYDLKTNFGQYEGMVSGTAGQLGANTSEKITNLTELQELMKDSLMAGSRFFWSKSVREDVRKLLDADGRPLWQPSLTLGTPGSLLGAEGITIFELGKIGTDGAKAVYFGDMSKAYYTTTGTTMWTARDEITVPGKIIFNSQMYLGGKPFNTDALKGMELSA